MYLWTLKQFTSSRPAIEDWRRKLSPARRAHLDTFLKRVGKMESWPLGICDPLKGYPGKWELRWTAEKVEHRIFGWYEGPHTFVMLIGCTHKGNIYDPAEAFKTMMDRDRKLKTKEGTLSTYEISR